MKRLSNFLFQPESFQREEDRRMAKLLLTMVVIYCVVGLFTLAVNASWKQKGLSSIIVIGMATQTIPLLLLLWGNFKASSYTNVIIYTLSTAALGSIGNGIHDYVMMLYPIIIVFGGLTAQKRGLLLSTVSSLLAIIWLVIGENAGWFIVYKSFRPDSGDLIIMSILILLTAWTVHTLVSNEQYGLSQMWRELAEQERVESALRKSEELIRNLNNNLISGMVYQVLLIDGEKRKFTYLSESVKRLYGITPEQGMANPNLIYGRVYEEDRERLIEEELKAHRSMSVFKIETRMHNPDGSLRWSSFVSNPTKLEDGNTRWDGVELDITELKRTEQLLRESEESLREIFENSPDNIFVFDVRPDSRFRIKKINSALEKIFKTERVNIEGKYLDEILNKDSVEAIIKNFRQCIEIKAQLNYEEFASMPGRWYSTNLIPILNESGDVTRLIGVSRDITIIKDAEKQLRENELKFRTVANNTSDWEFWQSPDGSFIYNSPSCKSVTGLSSEEFMNDPKTFEKIIHPDDLLAVQTHQEIVMEGRVPGEVYFRIIKPDGSIVWISHKCQPVFNENGEYLGARGSNRNETYRKQMELELEKTHFQMHQHITEIEKLQEELREQALLDPLTGLFNRRYMNESAKREFSRAERETLPVSMIMLDMDELKLINDKHGHPIGDHAIQSLASCLKMFTRTEDIVCRYGGDEFNIMMTNTTGNDAVKRVEEWQSYLIAHPIPTKDGGSLTVKFTAGIACYPDHGSELNEIINYSDMALYKAKERGRNCIYLFKPPRDDVSVHNKKAA